MALISPPCYRRASPANPQYQVRLYCTNEDYFNPHRASSSQSPAPIDFPATCEIKLNYINVPANTKGIKKQVGTASPVDLAKGGKLDITAGAINRLEVIYVNTEKTPTRVGILICRPCPTSERANAVLLPLRPLLVVGPACVPALLHGRLPR